MSTSWFWQDVRESLWSRPLKTALTFLSVAIGMLALSMLLAILAGLQKRAEAQVAEIGADVVMIANPPGANRLLNPEALARLQQLIPGARLAGVKTHTLSDDQTLGTVNIIATDAALPAIRGWSLVSGRWIDDRDVAEGSLHALISAELAARLFLKPGDPLILRDTVLKIAGIIMHAGDSLIVVPYTAPVWWGNEPVPSILYDQVYIKIPPGMELDTLVHRLQRDFEAERRRDGAAWTIVTPETLIASTRDMMRTVRIVYGSVAALCLLLGGVTLFSLMMVGVQQRVTELGLRMAIGASWRDIFRMFLCEGLITTFTAGVCGMLAGLGLLGLASETLALPVTLTFHVIALPLLISILLGLLFSWYPAHTAASMAPADALRNE